MIEYLYSRAKEEMIDAVCRWLGDNAGNYLVDYYDGSELDIYSLLKDLRKAMS